MQILTPLSLSHTQGEGCVDCLARHCPQLCPHVCDSPYLLHYSPYSKMAADKLFFCLHVN